MFFSQDALPLILDRSNSSSTKHYHVLYCHVPKSASTAWMRAMASLGSVSPERVEQLTREDAIHKEMLEGGHSVDAAASLRVEGDIRIVFVRHPFSRWKRKKYNPLY